MCYECRHGLAGCSRGEVYDYIENQAEHAGFQGSSSVPDGGRDIRSARSPELDLSFETLVDHAGAVVSEETSTDQWGRSGNEPGYDVSPGERVLLVADSTYDQDVIDAFTAAIHNIGAKVDVVINDLTDEEFDRVHPWHHEIPGLTRPETIADDQFTIIPGLLTAVERFEQRGVTPIVGDEELIWWESVAETYDLLVYGIGGPTPYDTPERSYRYERIPWRKRESLASDGPTFPRDVWELIDEKTAEVAVRAEEFHLTDPEGTDLRWTNYVSGIYPRDRPCHVFAHPLLPTAKTDTEGVISGTTNHANAFPNTTAHIENGRVVAVEGGGEYGDAWRTALEVMDDFADEYTEIWHEVFDDWAADQDGEPDLDRFEIDPGFFWLWEVAIGTNPKYARPVGRDLSSFTFPLLERMRAGVVHCGLGTPISIPNYESRARDRNLPWGHVHLHLLFPTLEAIMPSGETRTLIDHGYLTVLEDPEVREKAAKYGDPDDILGLEWIPEIPGISTDGNYEEYGKDPHEWFE